MEAELKNYAKKKARYSKCRFKVSAVGFDRFGKYLGVAYNRQFLEGKGRSYHAEVMLIKRYGKRLSKIFIMRVGRKGDLLPIDPCVNCKRLADKLGIKIFSVAL